MAASCACGACVAYRCKIRVRGQRRKWRWVEACERCFDTRYGNADVTAVTFYLP